ncbi:phosphoenolpyruvate synthase [Gordonia sp. (in: high G+C Gram-positive bacteria)]|jgi:pyruvate,water dikinase|uniref:phosphoenolpyruvate synthase n=1 Tax=Gordonia sp. (in: high G+C Gram-positive bacteria) TaxID=84139 RepID=UPI001D933309|nr:phosphoenolpyruvate synthase [Gordonia sp. (in: high G+C Gram-positive bacteria)]MCB1295472.1 phosphoenolpyruvate synthase [Gordonia sp. (in: high G+C Gram-positive bacteria)]HMS75006.1 phosphoenolpyruvate synthase [Gordonia sp. (in: high G+C Gram-positive bacteria)]HQV17123.1 phosphoenolpyruvate synthase [Gordonia sp. (in: high G+C Gram-positive bacteria)]
MSTILWFTEIGMSDVPQVGGKNASLGEMVVNLADAGVRVPGGFATTADAYRDFLAEGGLDAKIRDTLTGLDVEDVTELARRGEQIRRLILDHPFPEALERDIRAGYDKLVAADTHPDEVTWAVRSSATAEDLPDASFAGQQETYLNIGGIDNILEAVKSVFASLYNDRAIAYRVHHGFVHDEVALSAGVQRMVRTDIGASGVMFTVDTESGFDRAVFITAAYGLGEAVVQGAVNPDEFYVYKPAIEEGRSGRDAIVSRTVGEKAVAMRYAEGTGIASATRWVDVDADERLRFSIDDDEVTELARHAIAIEKHYGRPMDIEWGRDGLDGRLYILQARPETVVSRRGEAGRSLSRFEIDRAAADATDVLVEGRSIGQRIGAGPVRVLRSIKEMDRVRPGDVLVAAITDPDWEPVMKRAAAIITERGGRTCHAAIIARELGVPAIVGTGDATTALADGQEVTVSCAEGDTGRVYRGLVPFQEHLTSLDEMPEIPVKLMMNVATPDQAFSFAALPNSGVGLARMEFIINRQIGVHPKALIERDSLAPELREQVDRLTAAYPSPTEFFVRRVVEGVSTIAAAFDPKPVIVRLSDFKSNEYANLLAGDIYEPDEENPMIGYRGAARYVSEGFRDCFALECEALRRVRDEMGLRNVKLMVPFVRTVAELDDVLEIMASHGLKRGENGLQVVMMCEVPVNYLLADEFLDRVDGFSIGSNDMTQLILGVDRDSGLVAHDFDERNPAVLKVLASVIETCRRRGKYVGICGQGPSDHPDLASWLVEQGIESMSLTPDTVVQTWLSLTGAQ